MVSFDVPLPQQSNAGASALAGFQAGQELSMRNAQLLAYQEQVRQRQLENERLQATQSLAKAAISGDPNSLAQLSVVAPDMAKGVRDYNNYKLTRSGQLWQSVTTAPKPVRQKLYSQAIQQYQNEFGETPNVPAEYSPEAEDYLKGLIAQSRDVEKVAAEEFERPLQQQRIISEGLQQQRTKADTARIYQDISKSKEELELARQERERIKASGLSPTAYKKTQEALGEAAANETLIKAGFQPKLSGEGAKTLTIAQSGLEAINSIRNNLFDQQTGNLKQGSGRIVGGATFLPNVLQKQDQQEFELARKDLNDLIGRLRSGGAINKDELATYKALVPRFGDKPETIKKKLTQLENNFSTLESGVLGVSKKQKSSDQFGGGGEDPLGIR